MEKNWFESTKIVAYFLWEHSGYDNALDLWYAAEDIACFFEQANILDTEMVDSIVGLGIASGGYIWFVRHIAYRLHLYTQTTDELINWFLAERLIAIPAWIESLTDMAALLRTDADDAVGQLRSDIVRSVYTKQTL
jgi:hypothetical protein